MDGPMITLDPVRTFRNGTTAVIAVILEYIGIFPDIFQRRYDFKGGTGG